MSDILDDLKMMADGWKLVPVEPTPAMLDAASHASMQHLLDCIKDPAKAREVGSEENVRKTWASRYRCMLAAAPQPVGEVPMPPKGHPLHKLGQRLAELLDEHQWAECERLLLEGWKHGRKTVVAAEVPMPDADMFDQQAHIFAHSTDQLRSYGDAREAAGVATGGKDAERLDWLQEQAEKGCVSMCFDIDGGVHVTLDPVGEDQRAARNMNTVRDGIAALRGEVKP